MMDPAGEVLARSAGFRRSLRHEARADVEVGDESGNGGWGALPRFLARCHAVYGRLGKMATILACAAAHHWLEWGWYGAGMASSVYGRLWAAARLMSHAMLLETLDTGGVWSIPSHSALGGGRGAGRRGCGRREGGRGGCFRRL